MGVAIEYLHKAFDLVDGEPKFVLEDVNLLHRGGEDGLRFARENALRIAMLPENERINALRALDREMIERNLSPGGAADMLALGFLLDAWCTLSKDLWEVSA